jgi:isoamylase
MRYGWLVWLSILVGCAGSGDATDGPPGGKGDGPTGSQRGLGGVVVSDEAVRFRVFSARATRIELCVYDRAFGADEVLRIPLTRGSDGLWSVTVDREALGATIYYGYRAWGPNWPYDPAWTAGSTAGFVTDVDGDGNRFNPNKLLLDPYAREVSHDPIGPEHTDATVYASGPQHRGKDSGRVAPKAIVLADAATAFRDKPTRAFKDEVIYEVHVRGFTKNDPSVPEALRGTYAGAAHKAAYLEELGVTAVELLPVQETQNDQNDLVASTDGDNYWGYMTLAYFAPDRRYAADRSPGGPTREWQAMVRAFHAAGIKVYVDVVYNHTGEGGLWDGSGDVASLLSFRGLDNRTYYELTGGNRFSYDNTGVGGNFNVAEGPVRDLVIDSLRYWSQTLGVDGFRFDLASVLGNACPVDCFRFDALDGGNVLNRAVSELPGRPEGGGAGVDLIAEPWAIGDGTYQLGRFPSGWAEWNGGFRDVFRQAQNALGHAAITPGQLAARLAGSSDLYGDDGRRPWHSVNFLVAHDGFTLRDLYAYDGKQNGQAWPYGPSDGGEDHNVSWNQGGDPVLQRQAARTGLALLFLAAGVPMITGGDELYRTQYGNNNAYNLDSARNWLDYGAAVPAFATFTERLIAFRRAHPALRPAVFHEGRDRDGNGIKDVTWYRDDGGEADGGYLDDGTKHFLAYRLDGSEAGDGAASIYVAYNGWSGEVMATLPVPRAGKAWHRVADTAAWHEADANIAAPGSESRLDGPTYTLHGRSVLLLIER